MKLKIKLVYGILLFILLAGIGISYAATSGAALQVSAYSPVPPTIYPGTSGQLQVTILNAGTDTASAVSVSYKTAAQNDYSQVNPGDIGPGATAIVSIPFTIPQNTPSGFFIIYMNIYYRDSASATTKTTPITIPMVVAQRQILEVKTSSVSPSFIQPGDPISVDLRIINTGGVMNNLIINTPTNSSFTLEGTSQQVVGDILSNSSKIVSVKLRSSSTTASGKYSVPLSISYQDSLQNTVTQTAYVGPISVTDSSAQFQIHLIPITPTEVGSVAQFDLILENRGGSSSSAIVDINQSSEFTMVGTNRVYFDLIEPGQKGTQRIALGIGANSLSGYYNLPVYITTNGKTYIQNIGIVVNATPEIAVSTTTNPQFISSGNSGVIVMAQIANTGDGPIRSVYASVEPTDQFSIVGGRDKFIGTLNVDDSATFQFTMNVKGNVAAGSHIMPITIKFKDSKNQEQIITKNVEIEIYSQNDAANFGGFANGGPGGNGGNNARTITNGRAGAGASGGLFGLGLIPTIIIAIVILSGAYFGYKKFKGSKK